MDNQIPYIGVENGFLRYCNSGVAAKLIFLRKARENYRLKLKKSRSRRPNLQAPYLV
jgi:hypothetical protein